MLGQAQQQEYSKISTALLNRTAPVIITTLDEYTAEYGVSSFNTFNAAYTDGQALSTFSAGDLVFNKDRVTDAVFRSAGINGHPSMEIVNGEPFISNDMPELIGKYFTVLMVVNRLDVLDNVNYFQIEDDIVSMRQVISGSTGGGSTSIGYGSSTSLTDPSPPMANSIVFVYTLQSGGMSHVQMALDGSREFLSREGSGFHAPGGGYLTQFTNAPNITLMERFSAGTPTQIGSIGEILVTEGTSSYADMEELCNLAADKWEA